MAVDAVNHVVGVDRPPHRQRRDQQGRVAQLQFLMTPQVTKGGELHPCRQHHRQRNPSLHDDAWRHRQIKAVIQNAQQYQRRNAQQEGGTVRQPFGLPKGHQRHNEVNDDPADQRNMPLMTLARIGFIH
ncbi:hypothetical protein D3C78_1270970 [compost metagenome]